MSERNILIVAGEKSGEEHAKSFLPELMKARPDLKFFGVGGSYFESLGVELLFRLKNFQAMGFSDVIFKIPFFLKAMNQLIKESESKKIQEAILIDFQTFNLKLAQKLSSKGVKVFYYVAPQAWAWKEHRVKALEKSVEHLFCILPFEQKWFKDKGVNFVSSVEHPLVEKDRRKIESSSTVNILFLPGSRNSEVKFLLPVMSEVASYFKGERYNLILVKASVVDEKNYFGAERVFDEILFSEEIDIAFSKANFAVAASGTVTLECGLWKIPTVVCYKLSLLNELIATTFISYKGYASLVNIILEKEIFPELLLEECSPIQIKKKLDQLFLNYSEIQKELENLNKKMKSGNQSALSLLLEKIK